MPTASSGLRGPPRTAAATVAHIPILAVLLAGCGADPQVPRSADSEEAHGTSQPSTSTIEPPSATPEAGRCFTDDLDLLLSCSSSEGGEAAVAAAHARAADSARSAGELERCAEEYGLAYEADPTGDPAREWALASLQCHLEIQDHRQRRRGVENAVGNESAPPQALSEDSRSFDQAARRVACVDRGSPEAARAIYWMARLRYHARRYGEAAALFDAVVREAPHSDVSDFAAMLALDAVNVRPRQDRDTADDCSQRLRELILRYRSSLCTAPIASRREDTCGTLGRLHCQTKQQDANHLGDEARYAEASALYEELAADVACQSARTDELLFNAARLAELAGDATRAQALRNELRQRFPDSALARPRP